MNEKQLLMSFGLKYNPFLQHMPVEDLWHPPALELFLPRIDAILINGGFVLISGDPGLGKSKILQITYFRLGERSDLLVGVMERPQSSLGDFYRELGELYGVSLTPANRYGGFKTLRSRFRTHIKSTLFRPVLLIDEAQEVPTECLNELRLLSSAQFDSECLLTTIICGNDQLAERFTTRDLIPLGSRIRHRLVLGPLGREDLRSFLEHILSRSGAPHLMTDGLKHTLCEHAGGNLRILTNMSSELLLAAAEKNSPTLDEKLFLECFSQRTILRKRRMPPERRDE